MDLVPEINQGEAFLVVECVTSSQQTDPWYIVTGNLVI